MVRVFLGLGANLGDRLGNLRGARHQLQQAPGVNLSAASALYETHPVGGPPGQNDYLNAVLAVRTTLSPRELLHLCQTIEANFARQRRETWGPRTLDIDLLLYGNEILQEKDLIVPHPQLHRRAFVLQPLTDLAPDLPHPILEQTPRELLAELPAGGGLRKLCMEW
ncbi:MAG: 2-amino-4-hydroxy-6-hydroxymethyldihydropteridine diphosphokinase [Desulfuromonadales bacterium]